VIDALVIETKKAAVIWCEPYCEEGLILTEVVEVPQRNLGRTELAGPVLVTRIIGWIEERDGPLGVVKMWVDNLDVVTGCEREKMSMLPSQACPRNTELWLPFFTLKQKCGRKLLVKHLKAHRDNNAWYETLNLQSKISVDCKEAAKCATRMICQQQGDITTVPQGSERNDMDEGRRIN